MMLKSRRPWPPLYPCRPIQAGGGLNPQCPATILQPQPPPHHAASAAAVQHCLHHLSHCRDLYLGLYRAAMPPPARCPCASSAPRHHRLRSRSLDPVPPQSASDSETDLTQRHSPPSSQSRPVRHHYYQHMRRSTEDLLDSSSFFPTRSLVGTRGDADSTSGASGGSTNRPRFVPVTRLEDVQAVRCAEFHPSGKIYAVGSNSKTLRLCSYPKLNDIREEQGARQPNVLVKRTRHHKGSIYCMAWSPQGHLMATGSNDKTVKLISFNPDTSNFDSGKEMELTMHDGTVRDVCFIEDAVGKACLLVSGGAGDCKIYVTDCATGQPFQALSGHSGPVLSLHTWGGALFASGSQDRSVRLWDLRSRSCVSVISPPAGRGQGSPAAAVCVDPSGRLLVSGHEDASCVLYDVRGARSLQTFRPHQADVRSIRFSPSAYYLLTAGYDNRLVLTDLQGDLTMPLPSVVVACHQDKVISGRWHPSEFSFVSTSADKTSVLWALPPL